MAYGRSGLNAANRLSIVGGLGIGVVYPFTVNGMPGPPCVRRARTSAVILLTLRQDPEEAAATPQAPLRRPQAKEGIHADRAHLLPSDALPGCSGWPADYPE